MGQFSVGGNTVHLLPFFFVPADGAEKRARKDRVPYPAWIKQGHIEATQGNVIDYEVIRARINELAERYQIREIAIDRWNATQLSTQLSGDGFEIVGFGQGFASMAGPCQDLERRVLGQTINHGNNPVLRWMASNVTTEQDAAGNLKPSKKRSTERIDGIVATLMSLGRVAANHEDQGISMTGFTFV